MTEKPYQAIVSACEAYLHKFGDNYLGVGWTRAQEEVDTRYRVMLELLKPGPASRVSLLDFGCGASHLYEYLLRRELSHIDYSGLDLSPTFLELSRKKFPALTYYHLDILEDPGRLPEFDYIVLSGVFNSKCELSFEDMMGYFEAVVRAVYAKARIGIAFNVMSKQVDWEREDLFHLPFDRLAGFLTSHVSRHFVIRHDYGLYEYTTYVYRQPTATGAAG